MTKRDIAEEAVIAHYERDIEIQRIYCSDALTFLQNGDRGRHGRDRTVRIIQWVERSEEPWIIIGIIISSLVFDDKPYRSITTLSDVLQPANYTCCKFLNKMIF